MGLVVGSDGCTELTGGRLFNFGYVSSYMLKRVYAERARIRFISW